jgi:hypothetical protein
VTVTDTLPLGGFSITAATTQGTTTINATTRLVTANIGTMALNATVTVTITMRIVAAATFSNTAAVTASSPGDPTPGNNSATATTTVVAALGAVQNFQLAPQQPIVNAATDPLILSWSPPADLGDGCTSVQYDVLRTGNPADWMSAALCVATNISVTTATDFDTTPMGLGEVRFYLVRAFNACGTNMGEDSDGNPRTGRACP